MKWKLEESGTLEAILFQNYPDPVHLLDGQGHFLRVNPAWERILGRPGAELLGQALSSLVVVEDLEKVSDHLTRVWRGEIFPIQVTLRSPNDSPLQVEVIHFPLSPQTSKKILFGIVKDVTERRRMEELLAFQTNLLNQARSALVAADRQGRILFWNRFAEELYQWKAEEVKGRDLVEVMAPRSVMTLRQSAHWEGEVETTRKDGSPLFVHLSHSVIRDRAGRVSGTICVATDITERKEMEEEKERLQAQLRQAQKLESIGTITSGVAHNFNNVMAAILGNSQLIQVHSSDPAIQGYAKMIDRQVLRGSTLVNHLMRFSRAQQAEPTVVNLVDSITEVYHLISRSFDRKIEIETDLPSSLQVRGDPTGLVQVFMNICTNARDAMPEGGRLRIEASQEGERAKVVISDTGHGMSREVLERIFDPFFTTKPPGKGTGLGLSTAYGIVEGCGGEIRVDSEPGRGTTFTIFLPLAQGAGSPTFGPGEEIIRGKGERILIVDDEPDLLETLVEVVRNLGYEVERASDGEEAIERFKAWRPDVIIIDRNMPKMDGISCARRILEVDPQMRIIIASGYAESTAPEIDEAIRRAVRDYITKPFRTAELSQALARALKA